MSSTPHYVRVARALALVTGLAGLAACGTSTTPAGTPDAGTSDSGTVAMDSGSDPVDAGGDPGDAGAGEDAAMLADAGAEEDAAAAGDAGPMADAAHSCETCFCPTPLSQDGGPGAVSCDSVGLGVCCAVIGPLFPPDLPA